MTPEQVIADYIRAWEGGLSLDPSDNGNWTGGRRGAGTLVGSKFGVTAAALAKHRNVSPIAITKQAMALLSIDEAAAIGRKGYYDANKLSRLKWNRVTASVLDFGWGAGPVRAVEKLQALIGVTADGDIGPKTIAAYDGWIAKLGEVEAAKRWGGVRDRYYQAVASNEGPNDPDARFLRGWKNRTAYFLPGHAQRWWERFAA